VEKEVIIAKTKVGIEPLVAKHIKTIEIIGD
jgi:hypothetical protein